MPVSNDMSASDGLKLLQNYKTYWKTLMVKKKQEGDLSFTERQKINKKILHIESIEKNIIDEHY